MQVRKQWSGPCGLCAVARCLGMAETCETAHKVEPGTCKWTVEFLDGGINGWNIKYTDGSRLGALVKRHGH